MRAFPICIHSRIRLIVLARKGISGQQLREVRSLLFVNRDVTKRVPVEDMRVYVLLLSDLMPFFVEFLLICVCLRPMQNKALNDNVRRTLLPLSRCLSID